LRTGTEESFPPATLRSGTQDAVDPPPADELDSEPICPLLLELRELLLGIGALSALRYGSTG
jgi:hypothetical protein